MKGTLPKILLTAYAVNPYKGSEDGTGWNIIAEIAKNNHVIAITRKNNKSAIEKYLTENNLPQKSQLSFEYFDLPYWMRFWKKGGRGALLYYYLWQIGIVFFILKKKLSFDLVHQLNFHNDWTPSFLWILGKPFVWGPIGHHPTIPKAYLINSAGKKAYYFDQLKWKTKQFFWNFDPFLKITKSKAKKIFTINSSVKEVLNFSNAKEVRLPAVASVDTDFEKGNPSGQRFQVLSIGRFVPLKGFDITIKAFAHFYHHQSDFDKQQIQLTLIGKGPQKKSLQRLVKENQISGAVKFIDWIPKNEVKKYFQESSLFFFPSHEGAGMVVPEALSFGLPILCFDNIGPGEFIDENCGIKIPYCSPRKSILYFSNYLDSLFKNEGRRDALSHGARQQFSQKFTWSKKGEVISQSYLDILYPNHRKTNSNISKPKRELIFN